LAEVWESRCQILEDHEHFLEREAPGREPADQRRGNEPVKNTVTDDGAEADRRARGRRRLPCDEAVAFPSEPAQEVDDLRHRRHQQRSREGSLIFPPDHVLRLGDCDELLQGASCDPVMPPPVTAQVSFWSAVIAAS
jgi:hypothetical protein